MEQKFVEELEVKNLLRKVRDSYDMTKNMINKQTRGLLMFNKHRVINSNSEGADSSSDNVSSSSDSAGENKNITFPQYA